MTEPYGEPVLDEEPIGTSLVPIEPGLTMIDVDGAVAAWEAYQDLCRRILNDTDYAEIAGLKARKRSGWAKLRRFYGVTIMVTEQQRTPRFSEWEPGQAFVYRFTVTGRLGDRVEEGDGACESTELEGSNFAPTEHNVRAKALTRAKNRVTSDLIGGGEVSAEELNSVTSKATKKKHWIEYKGASKKFWAWAHERLRLTDDEVHEALGVKKVKEYTGKMKEAKKQIEEWLADRIKQEAKDPDQPAEELDLEEAITTGHREEDTEALHAYAKAKGIATGIVKTVLEEMGGAIEETLASLKEKYGEVE